MAKRAEKDWDDYMKARLVRIGLERKQRRSMDFKQYCKGSNSSSQL